MALKGGIDTRKKEWTPFYYQVAQLNGYRIAKSAGFSPVPLVDPSRATRNGNRRHTPTIGKPPSICNLMLYCMVHDIEKIANYGFA